MTLKLNDEAIQLVRNHLPQCWAWSHENFIKHGQRFSLNKQAEVPKILSTNMCRHTSLFLLRLLESAGVKGWTVGGGLMRKLDDKGEHPSDVHYWLENGNEILDITADQFGWDPIVRTDLTDPRYVREPARCKKKEVSSLVRTITLWEGEYASFWQQSDPRFIKIKQDYPVLVQEFKDSILKSQPSISPEGVKDAAVDLKASKQPRRPRP